MVPDDFHDFFVASAGVSGALIGLLFVATAIAPERIVRTEAPALAQETSAGAFLVLGNTLFISLTALLPASGVGTLAVVLSLTGVVGTLTFAVNSFRHRDQEALGFRWWWRRASTIGLFVWQGWVGYNMATTTGDETRWTLSLCIVNLILYAIGLSRAWQLLGGSDHGVGRIVSDWRAARAERATSHDAMSGS